MLTGDILRRSANRFPGKPAILWGDEALPYRAFNEQANRLAHALIGLRLPQQSKIAIMSRNRTEYAIAFFGCAKSGHVLVNISVLYAPAELTYDRATRTFSFPANFYFIGGLLDVYDPCISLTG